MAFKYPPMWGMEDKMGEADIVSNNVKIIYVTSLAVLFRGFFSLIPKVFRKISVEISVKNRMSDTALIRNSIMINVAVNLTIEETVLKGGGRFIPGIIMPLTNRGPT